MTEKNYTDILPEDYRNKAREAFFSGLNCSQSLVSAFAEYVDMDRSTLLKLSSSFGAGMGRLREVCGAVSGMFIIAGFLYGTDETAEKEEKADHYRRIQHLAFEFMKKYDTLYCRDLLHLPPGPSDPVPADRTPDYYAARPCPDFIGEAAFILAEYLRNNPPKQTKNSPES